MNGWIDWMEWMDELANGMEGVDGWMVLGESLIQSLSRAPKPTSKSLPRRRAQLSQRFTPQSFARSQFSQEKDTEIATQISFMLATLGRNVTYAMGFPVDVFKNPSTVEWIWYKYRLPSTLSYRIFVSYPQSHASRSRLSTLTKDTNYA